MFNKKNLRRALTTFLISGSLFLMPVANAEIYTAEGEYTMSKYETVDIAEQRAVKDAERYAIEQAGVYIESYSRMNNFRLLEDEIISVASGVLKHLEKPKIRKTFLEDGSIKIFATVKVEVSDSDIERYLSNSIENRQQLNSQLESLRKANAEQEKRIKELETQIFNVKTPQQEETIKEQFAAEDKIFLSNQKIQEGIKLWNNKDFYKSLELFEDALNLNPNSAEAYLARGAAYGDSANYKNAIEELSRAIQLEPKVAAAAYQIRGLCYQKLGDNQKAQADFIAAKKLGYKE